MKSIIAIIFLCAVLPISSCGNRSKTSANPAAVQAPPATASAPISVADSRASSIANREIIRRQEAIRRMDETALRASQAMAAGDLEGAVEGYRRASNGVR